MKQLEEAFEEAFGTALDSAYEAIIREGWTGRSAQEPRPDLGWTRDDQSKPEHSPEKSHEHSREHDRGIDR